MTARRLDYFEFAQVNILQREKAGDTLNSLVSDVRVVLGNYILVLSVYFGDLCKLKTFILSFNVRHTMFKYTCI